MQAPASSLLAIKDFSLGFASKEDSNKVTAAVKNINLQVGTKEIVAIVGESGSGKSVTAMAITKLLPTLRTHYLGGQILFEGNDLLQAKPAALRRIRGGKIGYVFQDPGTSLNPVFTIKHQLVEMLRLHRPDLSHKTSALHSEAIYWLERVGIKNPGTRLNDYPHQFSGGMQQRVMIAMALCARPKLLIADEPTTALDVLIQKQIIDLLLELRDEIDTSIIFITHNFRIINHFADRVAVMFKGQIVEEGSTQSLLKNPQHPYTSALIDCIPKLNEPKARLSTICYEGFV